MSTETATLCPNRGPVYFVQIRQRIADARDYGRWVTIGTGFKSEARAVAYARDEIAARSHSLDIRVSFYAGAVLHVAEMIRDGGPLPEV